MPLTLGPVPNLKQTELDAREQLCRELLSSAGRLAMEGFLRLAEGGEVTMKGPQDYLTIYDGLVEEHIRTRIAEAFPEDGFLGEEGGARVAPRMWVVDPIDGTANFARGIPHFAVSIAFVEDGRVALGGIFNPALDDSYFARRGEGATRNDRPIRVAATRVMERATVEFGWSPRIPNARYVATFSALLATGANIRRSASGALGLAYVADGRSDAYAELHINAWDCLAGLLLVEEAGGRVSPFLSAGGLLEGCPILAASPAIAPVLAKATGIALADPADDADAD